MAVCDAWSLKFDTGNMRSVEILPYFDTYSMYSMDCVEEYDSLYSQMVISAF